MNQWFVGIKPRAEDVFDLSGLTIHKAAEGFYWADPFLAEENGKTYLFMEETDYKKGYLVVAELDYLTITRVYKVLDLPTHCSFPSVTKIDGEWYMTPENVLSGELWIYKAKRFPDQWERFVRVAGGRYDDPVMRKTSAGYEIWTSTDGDKRRVFRSSAITGEWHLVESVDGQYERMAGHWIGDIRPVQDSIPIYGRAIKFKDIHNKVIRALEPTWYPGLTGTHTYTQSEHLVAIDGRLQLKDVT